MRQLTELAVATLGRCFLCGSSEGEIVLREGGYVGRSCECGIVYVDPMPASGVVDPTIDHHPESYYRQAARERLAWLLRFRRCGRVLEVGCGNGAFVKAALSAGFEVEAVEPCEMRARSVELQYGIRVERSMIEEARLRAGYYDIVTHVDLLSHFRDPIHALRAMRHGLSPGGVMMFEVGLFGGLPNRWYPFTGRPNFPTHLWFFDVAAVDTVLERAGLRRTAIEIHSIGLSTIVSSLAIMALRSPHLRRSEEMFGKPLAAGRLGGAYYAAQGVLQHLGKWLPRFGPGRAFVTAEITPDLQPI